MPRWFGLLATALWASACGGAATLEPPTTRTRVFDAQPVGAFTLGLRVTAESRALEVVRGNVRSGLRAGRPGRVWRIEASLEATHGSARRTLGTVYRCAFETHSHVTADLEATLASLEARIASDAEGRAVVGLTSPRWSLPCTGPARRWAAAYVAPEVAALSAQPLIADTAAAALARAPSPAVWLAQALSGNAVDAGTATEPAGCFVVGQTMQRESRPDPALAAYQFAAFSGIAAAEALRLSITTPIAGRAPSADTRLLARLASGDPALRRVALEHLGARPHPPLDAARVAWARALVDHLAAPETLTARFDEAVASCTAPTTAARCGAFQVAALRRLAERSQRTDALASVATMAAALPVDTYAGAPRVEARREALAIARDLRDPALLRNVALQILSLPDEDPMTPNRCLGPRESLVAQCDDPRALASEALYGACDDAVNRAAARALGAVRHGARIAGACLLSACFDRAEVARRVAAAQPRNPLNAQVVAMLPRWCEARPAR